MECVSIYGYVLAQLMVGIEEMTVRELDKDISTLSAILPYVFWPKEIRRIKACLDELLDVARKIALIRQREATQ